MNKFDVAGYFESKGYKVTRLEETPEEPNFLIEKNGNKKTVDVVEANDEYEPIQRYIYDRIMSGGFFVILPFYQRWDNREIRAFTKDDIEQVVKTYRIWWKK